ncbi:sulfatase-like hydrolase/transferase [Halomontanus rarus]|uniref:sulfatase-like hydrolase/transferase n=1 Tax=Halomontanus rarus TaxID=3034020 RepID=UPI0023E88938|nr:sulfatase-like hydrolase/transferase [Halovivax sp. TS33]
MADQTVTDRPNVLVVLTDQQRWDSVGAYGCPMDLTPNLNGLAAEGVRFENAFTSQPVCGPARACLQSGQYATTNGAYRNVPAVDGEIALHDNDHTLAREFRHRGYDTGYVGKWHLARTQTDPVPEEKRTGYEFWRAADALEFTSRPYEGFVYDEDGDPVELTGYRVDALTDVARSFLRREREDPFFLFVSYLEPHQQNDMNSFVAPDGYAKRHADPHVPRDLRDRPGEWHSELPDYYGAIERIDECFGRLLDELESQGIADDTVVLFTSDHGCHFGAHHGEHKRTCHDSSIRVPAIAKFPDVSDARVVENPISLVDLPPTLLDAAGIDPPGAMEGDSVVPLARGNSGDWKESIYVQLISGAELGRAIRTERWTYAVSAPDVDGLREHESDAYVERYLYDLHTDPHQRINLAGRAAYRDVADELRAELLNRMDEVEGTRATICPSPYAE